MYSFTQQTFNMVATTQQYLEPVLVNELLNLGATDVEKHNRAVSFTGDLSVMYRANHCTRTA